MEVTIKIKQSLRKFLYEKTYFTCILKSPLYVIQDPVPLRGPQVSLQPYQAYHMTPAVLLGLKEQSCKHHLSSHRFRLVDLLYEHETIEAFHAERAFVTSYRTWIIKMTMESIGIILVRNIQKFIFPKIFLRGEVVNKTPSQVLISMLSQVI